ncbi:MAG TPA: hypothetical protein IAB55_06235 [Candidatus Merdivicinus faecavium]|nr:hypothetical protein [Candidatus Merdivicinus faecavium]
MENSAASALGFLLFSRCVAHIFHSERFGIPPCFINIIPDPAGFGNQLSESRLVRRQNVRALLHMIPAAFIYLCWNAAAKGINAEYDLHDGKALISDGAQMTEEYPLRAGSFDPRLAGVWKKNTCSAMIPPTDNPKGENCLGKQNNPDRNLFRVSEADPGARMLPRLLPAGDRMACNISRTAAEI